MNIKKTIPNITTTITHLLNSGEVVEAKMMKGKPPRFYNALPTSAQFQGDIPNLKTTKIINQTGANGQIIPLSDTYTTEQTDGLVKTVRKIIFNNKKGSGLFVTSLFDKAGNLFKKQVVTVPGCTPRGLVSNSDFKLFNDLYQEADLIFTSLFENKKLKDSIFSYYEGNELSSNFIVKNFKKTLFGKHLSMLGEEANRKFNPQVLTQQLLEKPNKAPLIVVKRPLEDGRVIYAGIQKGEEPLLETLNISADEFRKDASDLSEIREIYLNNAKGTTKEKAYDIFTLDNENQKIKIIKDYKIQKIKVLIKKHDSDADNKPIVKTIYSLSKLNPNEQISSLYYRVRATLSREFSKL